MHVREAFGRQPQLAAVWGRYASSGTGSRLVMEEVLQALRMSGLPDEEIPARYHRLAVLIAALIASQAGVSTVTPGEHEQGMELFRVAVLGEAAVRPGWPGRSGRFSPGAPRRPVRRAGSRAGPGRAVGRWWGVRPRTWRTPLGGRASAALRPGSGRGR